MKSAIFLSLSSSRLVSAARFSLALLLFAVTFNSRAQLVWNGTNSGSWDVGISTNWLSGATAMAFANGAAALLNDSANGTTTLALAANLQPTSIVVSNTAKSYTLGGTGYLAGSTGLTKIGTNTLTINAASNTFTGAFIVSNGIVIVTNLANGGAASSIGASPSAAANWKLAGGTFSYRGAPAQSDRGYLVAGGTTLDVQGDLTLSGAINATAGTFSKSGAAKLTYRGTTPNQLTGGGANYQVGAGTIVFDGTAGGANTCSGQMFIGYNQANSPTVIFTNVVFTNNSWFAIARGNGSGGLTSTATFYNSTMYCTNVSLGYANGVAGNNQIGTLTLNGASRLIDGGNSVFNLSENSGSTCAVNLNDTSWIYSAGRIALGMGSTATGSVTIANSAAITNGGYVSLGQPGVCIAILKNNAVWSSPTDFNVADTANSQGTVTIQDNAQLIIGTLYVAKSANSTGTIYQNGGTVANSGGNEWRIGGNTSGAANQLGIYYLSNGVFNCSGNFQPGAYGTGYFNQSGGTATIGAWPSVARFAGSVGYLNVSGGTFNQTGTGNNLIIGEAGTGTLNVSGTGVVNCAGGLILGNVAGGNGTVNLNGGLVSTKRVAMNSVGATSALNFNGGILQAAPGASASFMSGLNSATVQSGGALLDSGTNAITVAQDLLDGGGALKKLGSGTLTLAGNLFYTGATSVSNGVLLVTAPQTFSSPSVTVSSGAGFGVRIGSANAQVTVPTLTLPAGASSLNFNFVGFGAQTNAPLFANSFAANGPIAVNISGFNFITGQFPLVQWNTRSGSGNFSLGSLPSGMVASLVTNVPNKSIDLVITTVPTTLPWVMKQAALMTDWAQQVNPTNVLGEYPRPQMVRSNWMNLNGVWEWQAGSAGDPLPANDLSGTILVPFCMESAISGVMEGHDRGWYLRTFTVPAGWSGQRVLLHFDAVDWECEPFINGVSLGVHQGGYDPFTFDITPYLTNSGPQKMVVRVYDPTDNGGYPRGKQTLNPGGIMYTACSGIWQPVWLEPVPTNAITDFHLVPDIDNNRLAISVNVSGATNNLTVNAVAFDGTNQIATANGSPGNNFYLNVPSPKLWSPTNPFLYDLQLTLKTNSTALDSVASYFGMRKISIGTNNGFLKIFLNNQFTFGFGPLDQGFWPDGIYTAPTDLALKYDIECDKAMGFNLIRKHIKVERQRWYYWADKLGVMVWQDMPSVNSYGGNQPIATNQFDSELQRMVTNHWNSPAIVSWVVFNEGQGQHDTVPLVAEVKALDPSRLVNQASGNDWFGVGDIKDVHSYPNPGVPGSATQAVVCGEFGGVGLGITNHTWAAGWGYVGATDGTNLTQQFEGFCGLLSSFISDNGESAAIYTQITDVETELNGLLTYDRKVFKPILRRMQTAITSLMGIYSNSVIVPSSQTTAQAWKYTFVSPAANWFTNSFNDSAWTNGNGAFGTVGTPGITVNTTWNTADIWMRRTFNPGALTLSQITNLVFSLFHDEGCEIYINGVLAASASGYITAYGHLAMTTNAQNAIIPNANNLLAVHCHQTGGGQGIDVGIDQQITLVPPPPIPTNAAPVLATIAGVSLTAGQTLLVTNVASDSDVPYQTLSWSLTAPSGATISTNGLVSWRPAISQSPLTNNFSVVVTDSGDPGMSATQNFSVVVQRPATPTFASPKILAGKFQSSVNGSAGPDYSVYSTTNLTGSWQLLLITNPASLPFQFVDPAAPNSAQRFYRIQLGP